MAGKPRDRMSPYAFFVQACWVELRRRYPEAVVDLDEFSRKSSERWKSTTARERGKFQDLSRGDKFRYEREMKYYVPKAETRGRKKQDPDKPKRPTSAFFLFSAKTRGQLRVDFAGLSTGDIAKKVGEKWAEQTPADKKPFEEKAAKLKEKYERDIEIYRGKSNIQAGKKWRETKEPKVKSEEEDEGEYEDDQ